MGNTKFQLKEQVSCRNHCKCEEYFKMALEEYGEMDLNVLERVTVINHL
jgi:hypothetical protein